MYWSAVVAFALTMYVIFDGLDLGVGTLLLFVKDERHRDRMIASIAPVWDGNETWIVLAGVGLFGGFPLAYAILLPAFYIPLITMLLALAFRGTAFEFRFSSQHRRRWDVAFGLGSIVAALAQGVILGGLVAGVRVVDGRFAGSSLDVIRPLAALTTCAVLAGYVLLGTAWLIRKTDGGMQRFACRRYPLAAAVFGTLIALVLFLTERPGSREALGVAAVAFGLTIAGLTLAAWDAQRHKVLVFRWSLAAIVGTVAALAACQWPYIVPRALTIWEASAPPISQSLLLIAVAVVLPVILGYFSFAYYVFRGKARAS
ncbi:MAG: cytochrome d ubiquinol oxidase subunit II [Candidatus Eremiobacteraeota bacterium]|nr:cytochrome d ubiquinol oxidase subunit II [Candidatus Eremiobacteraeota bacterium]